MLYHVGRILLRDFGIPTIAVVNGRHIRDDAFRYDDDLPTVPWPTLAREITDDDVLILGPSYSRHLYGWRIPGFKICYVQGFSTFQLLDTRLDYFVAVSDFVASFLQTVYGLSVNVIPPFVRVDHVENAPAWQARPPSVALPYVKAFPELAKLSLATFKNVLAIAAPNIILADPIGATHIPRHNFLAKLGSVRYLVTLSPTDGCALVPLEAMALGTLVAGYDGFGSRQYMRPDENCLTAPYPDIERSANMLAAIAQQPTRAEMIAERGKVTANAFGYEQFRTSWLREFERAFAIRRRCKG